MDIVSHYVERGRIFRQLERIADRVRRVEDHMEHEGPGCCNRRVAALRSLRSQRESLKARADQLSGHAAATARDGSVAAFVTFDRQEDAAFFLSRYPESLGALFCQREQLQLRGRSVRVTEPPNPSGIIWANLNVGFWSQAFRQLVTGVLTLVMLIASFLLLWFAAWEQQQFAKTTAVIDCTGADMVSSLLSGAINASSVVPLGGTDDPRLFCFCATQSFAGTPANILAVPVATLCPAFACPALFAADAAHINTYGFCVQWAKDRGSSIGLVVAAALSVLVINNLLALFMRLLTDFEGHHSYDSLNASLALRLFFAQFFNTGVLMVVINASAQPLQKTLPSQFKTGQYSDFTTGWYENVGAQLLTTMFFNIITPHLYPLFAYALYRWQHREARWPALVKAAKSQRDLNEGFIGPYNDYSLRYSQLYNTLFVCVVFSTGIPLLLVVALASFTVSYWVDKLLFVAFYRRPPAFNTQRECG